MSRIPIALQIWPVREAYGQDMAGTLRAIAEIGYEGVELCRWYNWTDMFDKWDAGDIRQACDEVGLKVVSSHIPYTSIYGEGIEALINFSHAVGMQYAIVASLPKEALESHAAVLAAAARFNAAAARLGPEGIRVGYHNHGQDFQPIQGEMPWDIFFTHTDPEVVMQLDIGNALHAGIDPYPYLERYPGRARLVHLKDHAAAGKKALAIGDGDVDWARVFDLCERLHDPEWYIVEQDCEAYTPMECARISLENLRGMGK